jgi:hypothetical protein
LRNLSGRDSLPGMAEQIIHLHQAAPAKPAEGAVCNGCGVCCALDTCPVGRLRFRQIKGPCPALAWSDETQRYHCGLLLDPGAYFPWLPTGGKKLASRLLARWISAGSGCDCSAETLAES